MVLDRLALPCLITLLMTGCSVGGGETMESFTNAQPSASNPTNPTTAPPQTTSTTEGETDSEGEAEAETDPDTTGVGPTTNPTEPTEPTEPTDPGICGDGAIDAGEACDGVDLGGMDCTDFGYSGGTLACTGQCMFDTDNCTGDQEPFCGDGTIDPGEQCDTNNLAGNTCADFGFMGGNLACSGGCLFDTSNCNNDGNPMCGNQPPTGNYSHCLDVAQCMGFNGDHGCLSIVDGNMQPIDGHCTITDCVTNADCPSVAGCSAVPECVPGVFNNGSTPGCFLDCSNGKQCPGGMTCLNINGLGERCF